MNFRGHLSARIATALSSMDSPWPEGLSITSMPFNPIAGHEYRGGNLVALLDASRTMGSNDPRWLTFSDIQQAGYTLQKGAKGQLLEYWKKTDSGMEAVYVHVFNGRDIDGLQKYHPSLTSIQREHYSRSFLSHFAATASEPDAGQVNIQQLTRWATNEKRLGFDVSTPPQRAKTELSILIANVMLQAKFGTDESFKLYALPEKNQMIALLNNDKHALFQAARDAERIVNFLCAKNPDLMMEMDRAEISAKKEARLAHLWIGFEHELSLALDIEGVSTVTQQKRWPYIEANFLKNMQQTLQKGLSEEASLKHLKKETIAEMKIWDDLEQVQAFIQDRQKSWQKYQELVKNCADGLNQSAVDQQLVDMRIKFDAIIDDAINGRINFRDTDRLIHELVYGEKGRRPINHEFVVEHILAEKNVPSSPRVEIQENPISPFGPGMSLEDALFGEDALALESEADNDNSPSI